MCIKSSGGGLEFFSVVSDNSETSSETLVQNVVWISSCELTLVIVRVRLFRYLMTVSNYNTIFMLLCVMYRSIIFSVLHADVNRDACVSLFLS